MAVLENLDVGSGALLEVPLSATGFKDSKIVGSLQRFLSITTIAQAFLLPCIVGLAVLQGCYTPPFKGGGASQTPNAKATSVTLAAPGKWGLALSGGGLRSGATSLGVLQELSASGQLPRFEFVASVSGGGYPIYGVVSELRRTGKSPAELLCDGSSYIKHVDNNSRMLPASLKFVIVPISVSAGLLTAKLQQVVTEDDGFVIFGATWDYGWAVRETFSERSDGDEEGHPYLLSEFRGFDFKGFPKPIFVTSSIRGTTKPGSNESDYNAEGIFELSPDWLGGSSGYWSDYTNKISILYAMISSAAALDKPQNNDRAQAMMDWFHERGYALGTAIRVNDNGYFLSDGGFADNTGILTLLNHGCRNILALDASEDRDARFTDIARLRENAGHWGWDCSNISSADGSVVLEAQKANDGRAILSGSGINRAWSLPTNIWKFSATRSGSVSTIWIMKLGISPNARYLPGVNECVAENSRRKESKRFPIPSYLDLSFEKEEFQAYRALGKSLVAFWVNAAHPPVQ